MRRRRAGREEFVAREIGPVVDLVFGLQELEALACEGLCNEDPHAPETAAAGVRVSAWLAARAVFTAPATSRCVPSSSSASPMTSIALTTSSG